MEDVRKRLSSVERGGGAMKQERGVGTELLPWSLMLNCLNLQRPTCRLMVLPCY